MSLANTSGNGASRAGAPAVAGEDGVGLTVTGRDDGTITGRGGASGGDGGDVTATYGE
jgi:hypothetical protein